MISSDAPDARKARVGRPPTNAPVLLPINRMKRITQMTRLSMREMEREKCPR